MKIVTAAEMVAGERFAAEHGAPPDVLMGRAGLATADVIEGLLGGVAGRCIVLAIGPGNNGGDGLIAAAILAERGAIVTAGLTPRKASPDRPLEAARAQQIDFFDLTIAADIAEFAQAAAAADCVVDSLFGTGKIRPITGAAKDGLRALRRRQPGVPLVAIDLPSGLDADTGAVDLLTPFADVTVTFGAPKLGMYRLPGGAHTGRVEVVDIGIPAPAFADIGRELIDDALVRVLTPARPIDAHKGTFGRVLIVAGSERFVGAAALSAQAALRAGAGLVTIATPRSVYERLAGRLLEPTFLPLPEDPPGQIAESAVAAVLDAAKGYASLVLGPGLGRAPSTDAFIRWLLPRLDLPVLIDADGLNALASRADWPTLLPKRTILTPHSGEIARLLERSIDAIEADRFATAVDSAREWKATVVLKGAYTAVGSPLGRLRISPYANPALATAGTGDVLSGIGGALLARGLAPFDAASLAVALHARAAARWSEEHGDGGMLASDLLQYPLIAR